MNINSINFRRTCYRKKKKKKKKKKKNCENVLLSEALVNSFYLTQGF